MTTAQQTMYSYTLLVLFVCLFIAQSEGADAKYTLDTVRLVNGDGAWQGRVEVFYGGEWGTVCDDQWDDNAAKVVCRMLRYSPDNAKALGSARFGHGNNNPILLDEVVCKGTELVLTECSHSPRGRHNCSHGQDAGVDCFYSESSTLPEYTGSPEELVEQEMEVSCDDNYIHVKLDIQNIMEYGFVNDIHDITSSDGNCRGTRKGRLLYVDIRLDGCGTQANETSSSIIYQNKILIYHRDVGEITRHHVIEVPIDCSLQRELGVESIYQIHQNRPEGGFHVSGNFNTTMEFFRDEYFYDQIRNWPHTIEIGQTVYVQLSLESRDPDLRLEIESCVAEPHHESTLHQHWLIRNRCPADSTTVIMPSGREFARFRFSTFQFVNKLPEVTINCHVIVCEPNDPAYYCQHTSCHGVNQRKRSVDRLDVAQDISGGPFKLNQQKEQGGIQLQVNPPVNGEKADSRNYVRAFVVALIPVGMLVALVAIAFFLKRRRHGDHESLPDLESLSR